jgi:hypothetical protein
MLPQLVDAGLAPRHLSLPALATVDHVGPDEIAFSALQERLQIGERWSDGGHSRTAGALMVF